MLNFVGIRCGHGMARRTFEGEEWE